MFSASVTVCSGFQSTLPARGATLRETLAIEDPDISIHAPRTGSDRKVSNQDGLSPDFNPRSPHGERPERQTTMENLAIFQSTLPARGATHRGGQPHGANAPISIHAPRTGSDAVAHGWSHGRKISIHAPRTGSDPPAMFSRRFPRDFNPRSPHGERRLSRRPDSRTSHFNPRSPHGERHQPGHDARHTGHFNPRSPHGERQRKVTILSIRIIGFAQKVYHKTVLLRISLAENAVILPKRPQNPVRTSLQKAGGLRFARAIRAARPYSISSPSGA